MKLESEPHTSNDLAFNTTPNLLTLFRILCVPCVIALLALKRPSWDLAAAILFGIASITDYFDGYLARRQNQETVYGKLMDPLADKFLVVSSLIFLQELGRISSIIVMILVCRELAITGLRALASAEGVIIAASRSAKWKTTTQMFAVPFIMVQDEILRFPFGKVGMLLLYVSLGISLWSAQDYIFDFIFKLREQRRRKLEEKRLKRELRVALRAQKKSTRSNKKKKKLLT